MSYAFNSFVACPNVQGGIEELYFKGDPTTAPGIINTLRAVVSPINESGIIQRQTDLKNGKYRTLEMVYSPRILDSDVDDSATLDCGTAPTYGDTSKLYEIDPSVGGSHKFEIALSELANVCQSDELYIAKRVAAGIAGIKRKMNKEAMQYIAANFGTLRGGGTLLTTKTKLSNGAFADDMLSDVAYAYQVAEGWDRPVVIGGELASKYMTAVNNHCCATVNVDLEALRSSDAQMYFFTDPLADSILGAGEFAFMAPGAIQLLRYNEFMGAQGVRMIDDQALKMGVVTDPETGLDFDYYAAIDCGVWNFQIKLAYKYVSLPEDIFFTSDVLDGVNYIFNGKVVNA